MRKIYGDFRWHAHFWAFRAAAEAVPVAVAEAEAVEAAAANEAMAWYE